jgi:N-acetylglucosamine kinase-like BadF-type ATPase
VNDVLPPTHVVALDAGQTGVRARVVRRDASVIARCCDLDAVRTNVPVTPQLAQRAAQVIAAAWPHGLSDDVRLGLAVGSTGLATDETADALLGLARPAGVRFVALAHDSITCFLGALGGARGAMVAAGTGVVTLGVGPTAMARVDGWGNQLGDDGSGFWIGREGLRAVMRAYDGRGPATTLTALVEKDFPSLDDAYLVVQRDTDWVRRVAGYSKTVAALAPTDPVCADIVGRAAGLLATAALVALRRCGELDATTTPTVATVGRLFDGDPLRAQFEAGVRDQAPGARFVPPLGDALDGAATLFDVPDGNPLSTAVRRAG